MSDLSEEGGNVATGRGEPGRIHHLNPNTYVGDWPRIVKGPKLKGSSTRKVSPDYLELEKRAEALIAEVDRMYQERARTM